MNRPLLFRAWDEKLRKMFVPHHIDGSGTLVSEERHEIGNGMFDTHPIEYPNPYVLMQFTGLLDSKGKEIFEGDIIGGIIGIGRRDGKPSVIDFTYGVFGFQGVSFAEGANEYNWTIENAEILGNIFENKDLLTT